MTLKHTLKAFVVIVTTMFAISALAVILPAGSDAADSFDITDGKGNTVTFNGPVDHIITIGVGTTATVIQLGCVDKIVVADKYSKDNASKVFDSLRAAIEQGKAVADGTIYSSGSDALKTNIIDAADTEKGGVFNKEKDVIILTGGDTYLVKNGLIDYFKDLGFRVLAWNDMVEYDDIITFTEKISKIVTGSVSKQIDQMKKVKTTIADTLNEKKVTDKREAFYLTYSSNTFKVGNTGSIATSMIIAAGGDAFTVDPSKSGTTYEANLTDIISEHGTDVIIFADGSSIANNPERLEQVRQQVGNEVKIVPLDILWNNYSIDSMNGVWTMACAMYPEYFSGDVPSVDGDNNSNVAVYIAAGVIVAIVIVGAVVFLMKRK